MVFICSLSAITFLSAAYDSGVRLELSFDSMFAPESRSS